MMGRFLIGALIALMAIKNGNPFFGVVGLVIAIHAIVLLFHPEELMDLPEIFFPEISSNDPEIVVSPVVLQDTAKRCAAMPQPRISNPGVCDRELDGVQ
jgi:hypothetical protein